MISNEVIKGLQVFFMNKDKQLAKFPDDKVKILSMKLHEDLGCVKYIFTDKTGTLTKNEMQFKACSIYTVIFDEELDEETESPKIINTENKKSIFCDTLDVRQIISAIVNDIPTNIISVENSPFGNYKQAITEFFLNIALNHNVLTEANTDGAVIYQGSNPDEVTLVTSAYELGVEFIERSQNKIRIKLLNEIVEYEVLQKFDFTSDRKRSSIVIKDNQGILKIYMKGSDNKIFENMDKFSDENIFRTTKEHVDSFAKRGLRTLCYSYRILEADEFYAWERKYNEVKYRAISDKRLNTELDSLISTLESNMILLGATALEDKLQDNVTEDIQEFIEAGINVWMITGDKLDTAESIGHSCKLFNDDTEVFRIKECHSVDEVIKRMIFVLDQMKAITAEMEIKNWRKKQGNPSKAHKKKKSLEEFEEQIIEKNIINEQAENNILNSPGGKKKTEFQDFIAQNNMKIIQNLDLDFQGQNGNAKSEKVINKSNVEILDSPEHKEIEIVLTPEDMNLSNYKKDNSIKFKANRTPNENFQDNETINQIIERKNEQQIDEFKRNYVNNTINNNNMNNKKYLENPTEEKELLHKRKPSDVNDASIIKFMFNNNYFESQSGNNTFINKMIIPNNMQSLNVTPNHLGGGGENQPNGQAQDGNGGVNTQLPRATTSLGLKRASVPAFTGLSGRNKLRNKSVRFKELDVNIGVAVNPELKQNTDFKDMFAYYHNKIQEIDKRKNTVYNFEFKPKRAKDKDESSDEESEDFQEVSLMNFGLIVEGESIAHCLSSRANSVFWKLMKKTRSIIACRCSPVLKAEIVSFVKKKSKEITLAIGDGGNDVNMIKTANVGVGIFGKEGYQAAFSSDYAVSQFRYLKRLIFYHGRYSLLRNSYFIYFFFFKNIVFSLPQLWLTLFTGFSGTVKLIFIFRTIMILGII
jgi:magnesium-transporting ATPase (P-type)